MMLTLFFAFLVQEPISSSLALSRVYGSSGFNFLSVHILYLTATSIDITVGYFVGSYIKKHSQNKKSYLYLKSKLEYLFPEKSNKHSRDATLFLLGPLIFPITAFLTPFINISFIRSYCILLSSEFLFWYTAVWGIVLGFNNENGIRLIHILLVIPFISIGLYKIYSKRKKT